MIINVNRKPVFSLYYIGSYILKILKDTNRRVIL